jgi:hypothetical protein
MLACGRSCCYGLSHFLLLTFPCWHSRVHSVISFILFLSIPSFTPLSPTARKSCLSFSHSVPFRSISLSGAMSFPPCISMWLQHCSVSLHKASPPRTYPLFVHYPSFLYIRSLLTALAFPTAPFGQKNPPNQLPAAPVHSALRYPCPGHSLHSQRLAHNAQAEYFVPFLYTRFSALLSTHAQGCFYYSV